MATNIKNHFVVNFDSVLKKYLYGNLVKEEAIEALYQFFGWTRRIKASKQGEKLTKEQKQEKEKLIEQAKERVHKVVDEVKKVMGLEADEKVNKLWFKREASFGKILKLFMLVNRFLESRNNKLNSILPVASIRTHFITIDTFSLFGIMKDAKLFGGSQNAFVEDGSMQWSTFLNFKKMQGKNKTFTGTIDTDNVSVCIHFMKPKKEKKDEVIDLTTKRVLGVDPGRTNILYVVEETAPDKFQTYRLTRRQYYKESGILKARMHTDYWHNENISKEIALLSTASGKSACIESFEIYLKVVFQVKEALWTEYFKKRWMQQRLRLYGGKKRVFSKFLSKLEKKGHDTVLAFGSAKFAPGGKNEVAVPTTRSFKECSYRFPLVPVDEFRTSKIHWKDDSLLLKVVTQKEDSDKLRTVRGLLWCCSTIEKANKFVNRDLNAAINIRRCAILPNRPQVLTRQTVIAKQTVGKII